MLASKSPACPGGTPTSRKKRRRRKSDAQKSVPASLSSNSEAIRTGGGDMAAAGPLKDGGREQGKKQAVRAKAPPLSPASGPSFTAVTASAGESRSPPRAVVAGGAGGGGVGQVRAPADGCDAGEPV